MQTNDTIISLQKFYKLFVFLNWAMTFDPQFQRYVVQDRVDYQTEYDTITFAVGLVCLPGDRVYKEIIDSRCWQSEDKVH